MNAPTQEVLHGKNFVLVPSDDRAYLVDIMSRDRFNHLNNRGLWWYARSVRYLWWGQLVDRPIAGGVLYFCFFPRIGWTFDAYAEREKLKKVDNKEQWAYNSSRLVLDWFAKQGIAKNVFAIIDEKNRGAKMLAQKLGFEITDLDNGFWTLRKGI